MMDGTVTIEPQMVLRDYQKPLYRYLRGGGRRAVAVWHRRAGKDTTALEWAKEAALSRTGVYWHMLPTLRQGRQVVWDGIDRHGNRMLDHWPGWRTPGDFTQGIVQHIRHDEMKVELANGSIWQVVGSDNYNSLLGANPVGVVFSEYSVADPAAWTFIRPILAENGGWALFIYTPRGRNHGYDLYESARQNEDWFAQRLTVDDTNAIPLSAVEDDRKAGMAEDMIQQEYYCSFEAALVGAYYAKEMADALSEERITNVPLDRTANVELWFDLGIGDETAIWFAQRVRQEIHLIDYYESSGEALAHYAQVLQQKQQEHGYVYGDIVWPHDGEKRELSSGETLADTFGKLGFMPKVLNRQDIGPGIDRARATIPRCWFDENRCRQGIEALRSYRRDWDEKNKCFKPNPLHDWSSHGADAFRYGCSHNPVMFGKVEYPSRPDII